MLLFSMLHPYFVHLQFIGTQFAYCVSYTDKDFLCQSQMFNSGCKASIEPLIFCNCSPPCPLLPVKYMVLCLPLDLKHHTLTEMVFHNTEELPE